MSMATTPSTPLWALVSPYFHQDYDLFIEPKNSIDELLEHAVSAASTTLLGDALHQLQTINASPEALDSYLKALWLDSGGEYDPELDSYTYPLWFARIEYEIRSQLAQRR